jgi:type III pantothenate kinase
LSLLRMKMNLIIDEGNTRIKAALFSEDGLVGQQTFGTGDLNSVIQWIAEGNPRRCIVSSTVHDSHFFETFFTTFDTSLFFDQHTAIPIINSYKTPATLGRDRLSGVIGAQSLYPDSDILVIDAGTAITFDYLDAEGIYSGGTISPGLQMRIKALHHFTGKLPLVEGRFSTDKIGNTTETAMQQGVYLGALYEIEAYCSDFYEKHPRGVIFLTGGDALFFDKMLKNTIFANQNIVLIGLNRILEYNAKK